MNTISEIERKYRLVGKMMDERSRRIWAAIEAESLGRGGASVVSRATGISRSTLRAAQLEVASTRKSSKSAPYTGRARRPGGGRKRLQDDDPALLEALERLVDPAARGDPMVALRWTSKSTRKLADELTREGWAISDRTVAAMLKELGFSLQGNRKSHEGSEHPDRNAQFEYISDLVWRFHCHGQPVISVDTKKKELVGDFKNSGREWRPKGKPEKVRMHDFVDKDLGKVIPYGIYDLGRNEGWVSVGVDHDTAEFAVESIRRWWKEMGQSVYPKAKRLLITADCGGSNGNRTRLWKACLQQFATEAKLKISVSHFPPGTSKWNKIEHRMFCHITQNWRGRPLLSRQTVVDLIANTKTRSGLRLAAQLDEGKYATGRKVSDEDFSSLNIKHHKDRGDWNYDIVP